METNSEQTVYLTAGDIGDHFGVDQRLVQQWRRQYGPDRPAERVAKAPTCPQPDMWFGKRRPQAAWLESRLGEWDAWKVSLPGHGAGGGRPRKS